jgi:hypothetical protein
MTIAKEHEEVPDSSLVPLVPRYSRRTVPRLLAQWLRSWCWQTPAVWMRWTLLEVCQQKINLSIWRTEEFKLVKKRRD